MNNYFKSRVMVNISLHLILINIFLLSFLYGHTENVLINTSSVISTMFAKSRKKYNFSDMKYALIEIPSTPQVYYEN